MDRRHDRYFHSQEYWTHDKEGEIPWRNSNGDADRGIVQVDVLSDVVGLNDLSLPRIGKSCIVIVVVGSGVDLDLGQSLDLGLFRDERLEQIFTVLANHSRNALQDLGAISHRPLCPGRLSFLGGGKRGFRIGGTSGGDAANDGTIARILHINGGAI